MSDWPWYWALTFATAVSLLSCLAAIRFGEWYGRRARRRRAALRTSQEADRG